jgi:hypothetical protein
VENAMTDEQLQTAIRSAVRTDDPSVSDLVAGGLARGQALRRRRQVTGAVAAVAVVALSTATAAALTGDDEPSPAASDPSGTATSGPAGPCRSAVVNTVLPSWARGGFSDPTPSVPHVMGDDGDIVAILFGRTLHSPPSDEVNNKILWVGTTGADPGGSLEIDAVLAGTSRHVSREVQGGPGPSTIDLPAAGCWHLELTWGERPDQQDSLDLDYVRP